MHESTIARLLAGRLLEPIHVPPPELEAARDLVRAREDARLDRMRDRQRLSKFCLRHGRLLPTSAWTVVRRKWLGEQRFEHAAEQITFDTYRHAVDLVDARIGKLERAIRETAEQGPWRELVARLRCLRGIDTLTALALVAEIGGFTASKAPRSSWRSSAWCPRSIPPASIVARFDHQGWQQPRAPAAGRGRLACAPTAEGRLRARPPPPRTGRRGDRARLALPASAPPALAADGRPRQTTPEDRRRLRPRACRLRLGDRDRAATQEHLTNSQPLGLEQRNASNHTENPRRLYAAPAPAGDPRPQTEAARDGSQSCGPDPRMSV